MNFTGLKILRSRNSWSDVFLGIFASFLLLCVFFPEIVFLYATPMHAAGWELIDPTVSWANFKPSFRVFQYELYTNFNVLWSSLRVMGMPILANDIQAAPLFPLTLLFSWLDEHLFWNVFVISRLFLMGLGTYLLARKYFNFNKLPSIYFIVTFVFALYVVRWLNHPWQNGFLAGIWYLYFLCETIDQPFHFTLKRIAVFGGLVLSVYMMVTCGFPEASVMSAILVLLTYVPLVISKSVKREIRWKSYLADLILAHVAGFALSSFQLFAILEVMAASESHRFVGLRQYSAAEIVPFFAENLTRFLSSGPVVFKDSRTYLGLIPITLFLIGLGVTIRRIKKIGFGETGALLCGLFIMLKMFAIGPEWFNTTVASLPVLRESYFYIYFFTIFLWFFSYFSAKGFQEILLLRTNADPCGRKSWRISLFCIPLAVFLLIWLAAPVAAEKSLWELVVVEKQRTLLWILTTFGIAFIVLQSICYAPRKKFLNLLLPSLLLILVIIENALNLPSDFPKLIEKDNQELVHVIEQLEERDIPLIESRIIDRVGNYVSSGLATIDTGATPIVPKRIHIFRTSFFKTAKTGKQAIKSPKASYSWDLTSTNLIPLDTYYGGGDSSFPEWSSWKEVTGGEIHLDQIQYNGKEIAKDRITKVYDDIDETLYLKGWAVGSRGAGLESTAVFIIFRGEDGEIVVPARKAIRHDVARHLGDDKFMMAGWDTNLSASIFPEGRHSIIIRFADRARKEYQDYKAPTNIEFVHKNKKLERKKTLPEGEEADFIGMLDQRYIYLAKTALPRAYTASECQYSVNAKKVIEEFSNTPAFRLGKVYMESLSEDEIEFCEQYSSEVGRIPIIKDGGDTLLLSKVKGPAVIVLNDNFYDGWQAVDILTEEELEIKPGNVTFRSLILPEEREYQIEYKYKPDWLLPGRILLVLGLSILLAPVVVFFRKRRKYSGMYR